MTRQTPQPVASGLPRGAALRQKLLSMPAQGRDAWVDALLGFEAPPPDGPDLPRGAVPYLPCSVNDVLAMLHDLPLGPQDTLMDLGSGVGRLAILAHLLSGAQARGIEVQRQLVHQAQSRCDALKLNGAVTFEHGDAAKSHLHGTAFSLYAPFGGPTLAAVLQKLQATAQQRPIMLYTIDLDLGGLPWLCRQPSSRVSVSLYRSR